MNECQSCISCGKLKPIHDFEWQKNRPNPRSKCKQCRYEERDFEKERPRRKEYAKERRKNFPELVRQQEEKSRYGITKEQIGIDRCCICGSLKNLCIDHNHKTKEVRGILCSNCNRGLGYFKDNEDTLSSAIEYLKNSPHF